MRFGKRWPLSYTLNMSYDACFIICWRALQFKSIKKKRNDKKNLRVLKSNKSDFNEIRTDQDVKLNWTTCPLFHSFCFHFGFNSSIWLIFFFINERKSCCISLEGLNNRKVWILNEVFLSKFYGYMNLCTWESSLSHLLYSESVFILLSHRVGLNFRCLIKIVWYGAFVCFEKLNENWTFNWSEYKIRTVWEYKYGKANSSGRWKQTMLKFQTIKTFHQQKIPFRSGKKSNQFSYDFCEMLLDSCGPNLDIFILSNSILMKIELV